ncbi:DUF3592 domain-containing protein [Pelagicoccus sp. NFK12]|uniref:DUF3592 domain-containing protein n=1 Tax=Pelagicoccus enzymogenes TaxID=2773457 RepID=A0A927IHA1_9BACT|nr:DUF3592 domain-containing protein [Pelagicoccus enzymogenes]MBD5782052.1 DUF3592 domain-containing protein [Pelagicoccus enzymogenes]
MSKSPSPSPEKTSPIPETPKAGRWSCLVWFGIAALIIYYFGFQAAEEDAHAKANWDYYEATITQSEARHGGLEGGWAIHYSFQVDLPSGARSYTDSQSSSKGYDKDEPVEGQFAIGNTLPVYINPDNPTQFHRPLSQSGLRWIAILGGGFFGLIGLSVLFSEDKKELQPPAAD